MMIEKAYAKINLGLEVLGLREDGFHELKMILLPITTCDTLWIEESSHPSIVMNQYLGPIEENLIYKVYFDIKKRFNIEKNASIFVDKLIPIGAGLGGGSSDAAATLRGLLKVWDININGEELHELALSYGSDVPFFLSSHSAVVEGRGEKITPLDFPVDLELVMIYPNYLTYTKEVFKHHTMDIKPSRITPLLKQLKAGFSLDLLKTLENDLLVSSAALAKAKGLLSPTILQKDLLEGGAVAAMMSGSGSAVYGICQTAKEADILVKNIQKKHPNVYVWHARAVCEVSKK
ncbi:MAG: 4-(cytidine 5'-diphospho)-2-C-methyl-D-erythritol kinase [Bacilli bacterium]